jgi:hypothetical protein
MIRHLANYLLPLNVLFDVLLVLFEGGGLLPYMRALWMSLLIIWVLGKYGRSHQHYNLLLVFGIYGIVNVALSSDIVRSLNISLKVLIPMLSFVLAFNLFRSIEEIRKLNRSVLVVYAILIANYVISQTLGIGTSEYTGGKDFLVGNMDDNWNVVTYAVLLAPIMLYFQKSGLAGRWLILGGAFMNTLLVIVSLKRIAILGLVSGTFIRFLLLPKILPAIRVLSGALLLAMLTLPFYEDLILKRLEARSDRFEYGALERENRFLETSYVWEEAFSFEDPIKSFFGLEGFNSVGNYAGGRFGNRNLHVDYNLIVNTIGLIGFILYFLPFVQFYQMFRRKYKTAHLSETSKKQLRATFFMLLFSPFITSFAGQMYHISYRMLVFVYLGAILGTLYQLSDARTRSLQR